MTITVSSNLSSLVAQVNVNKANTNLNKTLQQLSSGTRINSAKDDAAGLSISVGFQTQLSGSKKAMDNIQDGLNLLNSAESGMDVTYDHLSRIRDLCVQVANGTYSTMNRSVILEEIKQRVEDIDTQAKAMNFNGVKLLDGSISSLVLQIGAGSDNATNSIDVGSVLPNSTVVSTAALPGLNILLKVTTGTPVDASWTNIADWEHDDIMDYMDKIDVAINKIVSNRSSLGAYMSRLEGTYDNLNITYDNLAESNSRIVDLDYAQASSDMIKYQILQQVSTSVLAQANTVPQMALQLLQ